MITSRRAIFSFLIYLQGTERRTIGGIACSSFFFIAALTSICVSPPKPTFAHSSVIRFTAMA